MSQKVIYRLDKSTTVVKKNLHVHANTLRTYAYSSRIYKMLVRYSLISKSTVHRHVYGHEITPRLLQTSCALHLMEKILKILHCFEIRKARTFVNSRYIKRRQSCQNIRMHEPELKFQPNSYAVRKRCIKNCDSMHGWSVTWMRKFGCFTNWSNVWRLTTYNVV